jgi:hypothetical protein
MIDCEWDEGCCDKCEMDFYDLIDILIKDIQHLESKVVCLRYSLSNYLPKHDGEMLRLDIFHDLAGVYWEQPSYQKYISERYGNHDPMDCKPYNDLLRKLSQGEETAGL